MKEPVDGLRLHRRPKRRRPRLLLLRGRRGRDEKRRRHRQQQKTGTAEIRDSKQCSIPVVEARQHFGTCLVPYENLVAAVVVLDCAVGAGPIGAPTATSSSCFSSPGRGHLHDGDFIFGVHRDQASVTTRLMSRGLLSLFSSPQAAFVLSSCRFHRACCMVCSIFPLWE